MNVKLKKILFVTYGGGHARMLKPVIEELSREGLFDIHVLALNTAAAELAALNVTLLGYKDFFTIKPEVITYGQELVASLEKVIDYEETVAYLGANFVELVTKYGLEEAREMYNNGGRYIFEPDNIMHEILDIVAPDILVTTNSPRSERSAILAARKLKINSIALVDMFGIRCSSWFRDNDFADKILVLSESVKQYFVSLGRKAEDIVVTGNPSFDSLSSVFAKNQKEISVLRESIPFTVLWASQPEPAYLPETDSVGDPQLPLYIEEELFNIFQKNSGWKLIARNHPSEVKREYPSFVSCSHQSDDLTELFSKVHVVLTPSSTIGFQGGIMGAKLVTIDKSVLTPTMPYEEMGFSIGLKEFGEIEPALKRLEGEKNVYSPPPYSETNAVTNVTKVIMSML